MSHDGVGGGKDVGKGELLQCCATRHTQHSKELVPVIGREHLTTNVLQQRKERLQRECIRGDEVHGL